MKGSPVQVRASALTNLRCPSTGLQTRLRFSDYDGPTGLFIATGKRMLPLDSPAGATAFVGAGLQSGTNDPELAAQIQAAVDAVVDPGDSDAARF